MIVGLATAAVHFCVDWRAPKGGRNGKGYEENRREKKEEEKKRREVNRTERKQRREDAKGVPKEAVPCMQASANRGRLLYLQGLHLQKRR